jgi:hypothetical protein
MSKIDRAHQIPDTCRHCGGPLASPLEQSHRSGPIAYYCSPIRVYHPDGTPWLHIITACERDRAALARVLDMNPASLSHDAAEARVRELVALAQRIREYHLLPGSKKRAKLMAAEALAEEPSQGYC